MVLTSVYSQRSISEVGDLLSLTRAMLFDQIAAREILATSLQALDKIE
jgi:hypothetical protein